MVRGLARRNGPTVVTEREGWKTFRTQLKKHVPRVLPIRVETAAHIGVPDALCIGRGRSVLIELKVVKGKFFQSKLTTAQIDFFKHYEAAGGEHGWILAFGEDVTYLWPSRWAARVGERGIEAPGAILFYKPTPWASLFDTIFGEA
jgi:hypothetical protein